jgi:acetoin utilization deacetylase AcuC-like enzyme
MPTRRKGRLRGLLRLGRRAARRLGRALRPDRVPIVYHARYRESVPGVPLDSLRGERVLAFLLDRGLLRAGNVHEPRPVSVENLLRVHTVEYLRAVETAEGVAAVFGVPLDAEQARRAVELQRLVVGGTVQATRLALGDRCAVVHLGGGLHHAAPDRGMGFCIFNDVAVSIARLRARHFRAPILVIDLDLHDGNGTRAAFATDPTVHTFSIHNAEWDDVRAVADTRITLGTAVDDELYLRTLSRELPPVLRAVRPGLVLYIAGGDPAATDTLGDWRIGNGAMFARDRFVVSRLRGLPAPPPLVVTLGGGYGGSAWWNPARFCAWLIAGQRIDPPDDLELAIRRLERIRAAERAATARDGAGSGGGGGGWLDWSFGAEDLVGLGVAPARETRLLGRYTAGEVERLLEKLGVLEHVRGRGYAAPVLELDAASPLGQTVRLWGSAARAELLLELRLGRNRTTLPGHELLWIEWLLLQDPRARFRPTRPPLPGQEHPGLGVLPDIMAWLAVLCEEARLDGIGFRSYHFHIAALGRRHLRFVDPADERRFEGLSRALRGRPLAEATALVAGGRVEDARTAEPVRWGDVTLVLPVRPRLVEAVAAVRRGAGAGEAADYRVSSSP